MSNEQSTTEIRVSNFDQQIRNDYASTIRKTKEQHWKKNDRYEKIVPIQSCMRYRTQNESYKRQRENEKVRKLTIANSEHEKQSEKDGV